MLVGTLHALANFGDVGEDGLLVSFTETLRRWDLITSRAARLMVWVLLCEESEESAKEQVV